MLQGLQLWHAAPDVQARYTELCRQLQALTAEQLNAFVVPHAVSKKSLLQLLPERHLNDEVMNEMLGRYLQLNQQLSVTDSSVSDVHIFDTFFMDKLWLNLQRPSELRMKLDYSTVQRQTWPKKLAVAGQLKSSILDCHLVIVPCHLPGHWVVVVADLKQKRITYLDPLMVGMHWTGLRFCSSRPSPVQLSPCSLVM
jgi:Ulp1 family protease